VSECSQYPLIITRACVHAPAIVTLPALLGRPSCFVRRSFHMPRNPASASICICIPPLFLWDYLLCTGHSRAVVGVLPLVEALAKRGAASSMPGAASVVSLALHVNMAATARAELQQQLQARGLPLEGSHVGEQGQCSVVRARARLSPGPTVSVYGV
jgi:hypothetical protein